MNRYLEEVAHRAWFIKSLGDKVEYADSLRDKLFDFTWDAWQEALKKHNIKLVNKHTYDK